MRIPISLVAGLLLGSTLADVSAERAGAPFAVLVKLGLKAKHQEQWDGSAQITGGSLESVTGWMFQQGDSVTGDTTWKAKTRKAPGRSLEVSVHLPVGVVIAGRDAGAARITVSTEQGDWTFAVSEVKPRAALTGLNGRLSAQRVVSVTTLSATEREDDYPSACSDGKGGVWAVWQSYEGEQEQLHHSHWRDGAWSEEATVPGVEGDLFKPVCAVDATGRLIVVWTQKTGDDWELWETTLDGQRWSKPRNITNAKGTDFEAELATAPDGKVYMVWQAERDGNYDILLAARDNAGWSAPMTVTGHPANDWQPALAIDSKGVVSIAWDTYRNRNYDVYLRQLIGGKLGPEIPIAATTDFDAKSTVACDAQDRVWIAWEFSAGNWGKDQGYTIAGKGEGKGLYRSREVKVRCLAGDELLEPEMSVRDCMPGGQRGFLEHPRLIVDEAGAVRLLFRHPTVVRQVRGRGKGRRLWGRKAWENYATHLTAAGWAPATYFPNTFARIDTTPSAAPCANGQMAVVFHTDGKQVSNLRMPVKNRVFGAILPAAAAKIPKLVPARPQEPATDYRLKEDADLHRIRAYRTAVGGTQARLLRGDTHRHTEISWDGTGDGSIVDTYRYAIDAAALDFFEVTDHNQQGGPDLEYVWWRTQKITDLYHHPPAFCSLYGYERSRGYPHGHRNVLNAKRGFRVFSMAPGPVGGGPADDGQQLYGYARKTNSLVISHTTGTNMGTDFRDNDPALEPVVEIFQGARTSYEYEGAPKSAEPGDKQATRSGYRPAGFLWRAWEKGLRLGIIASSDHGSTHISYASVYADEPTSEAVMDGLRRRSTFGATDNLIVDVHVNGHFMGEEFESPEAPIFDLNIIGTAELSQVDVIKNFEFVYTTDPDGSTFRKEWRDANYQRGDNMYYVRVQQDDGQIAWGSPVWVE